MQETLGTLLLGEYWSPSWQGHVQRLKPPPLPPNLEEALKINLGVRVIEIPIDNSFPPLRGGRIQPRLDGEH